ncbi:unnamed protein product [Oikopleura dioica]|uniref:G-protein coupled receptors family 2 profile 2 domain-containing protein n=1 Tax=Oikopleura dioica TaxID=34765 RepID=E4XDF5_OIKDI|nr:unnamed protein product [Oikopleura dioica]
MQRVSLTCKTQVFAIINDIFGDSIVKIVEAYGNGEEEYMSLRKELEYCPQLVAAAAIAQYFITAVFFWMACEGVHLYYRPKKSVAVVLNKPRSKYITKLSVVGWGMPLLFTVIVLIVEATTGKGYTLNFEYAQSSILETNFWVFLDSTMYYVFILMPFVIIWLFNLGSNLNKSLINSQSNVVKTFQRISNFLSMSQPDKRKSTQTRINPPKLSRNVSNNATKNHQKRLQGMIGLLTILGGAQILMLLLANPSSNDNTLAYIFIILNGLQGVFIFIFYVLLREEVLKLLGFAIKPKIAKTSVGQKRSGMTDSSFFDPATPISDIPEEKFFQAISQKSSSNISTRPLGSPKLLRNRHVFWKSPTIRPETAGIEFKIRFIYLKLTNKKYAFLILKRWKPRQVGKRPESWGDIAPRKTYCQNYKLGASQFWLRKRLNYRRSSTMKVNSQKVFSCRKPSNTTANIFKNAKRRISGFVLLVVVIATKIPRRNF